MSWTQYTFTILGEGYRHIRPREAGIRVVLQPSDFYGNYPKTGTLFDIEQSEKHL